MKSHIILILQRLLRQFQKKNFIRKQLKCNCMKFLYPLCNSYTIPTVYTHGAFSFRFLGCMYVTDVWKLQWYKNLMVKVVLWFRCPNWNSNLKWTFIIFDCRSFLFRFVILSRVFITKLSKMNRLSVNKF